MLSLRLLLTVMQICGDHSDIACFFSPALVNENTSLKTELAELRGDMNVQYYTVGDVVNDGVISCP